jgi:DNA-binding response OmpR family regulator
MTTMCPHCGYDLERSEVIERGLYVLHPDGMVYRDGERVRVTVQEGQLLYTVAKAAGRPIHCRVIGERISDGENPYNLVAVLMTRLRAKFRADGIPIPVSNIRNFGLAWI